MIKLFRKIRYDLMNQNKTTKPAFAAGRYFKYAIGEIVLVVIGILIALQINNWNEEKKQKIIEQKILKELLVDLEISKVDLENDILANKRILKNSETIKNHIYLKKPNNDSIIGLFVSVANITQFTPRTSGYQNLQSLGLNIISNDTLRKQITNVFERDFEYSKLEGREFDKTENATIELNPFFNKHFIIEVNDDIEYNFKDFTHKTPNVKFRDYEALLKEKTLVLVIQKTIYDRLSKMKIYYQTIARIDTISSMIEEELKRLKND
tara:strand:+ start:40275 stop:41072 length:798 start_codon:yes stop_codon:yes gene_type:complete